MKYKGYIIGAECITGRAEYSLNEQGELDELISDIDCEPIIQYYSVGDIDGDILEWVDTLEDAKRYIDRLDSDIPQAFTNFIGMDVEKELDKLTIRKTEQ